MNRQRWMFFALLIFLFAVIAILFSWDKIQEAQTTFQAGTKPPLPTTKSPSPITPPIRDTDPAFGSQDAKAIPILFFGGYNCIYCRATEPEAVKAMQAASKPSRLMWRDLPLPNDRPEGMMAILSARCAGDQGKFWDMHTSLMRSPDLSWTAIQTLAAGAKLSLPDFNQCINSGKHLTEIQEDVALAAKNFITATPTIFVGDQVIVGLANKQEILDLINRASLPQ